MNKSESRFSHEDSPCILPSGRVIPGYKAKAGTPYTLFFYTRLEVFIAHGHWRCRGKKVIEYPGGQPR
jgi:hypothetical protein